jgi:hypothetical protein
MATTRAAKTSAKSIPAAKTTAKPAAKKAARTAAKTTAKPAAKKAARTAAKTTAKPAAKTTAKPAAKTTPGSTPKPSRERITVDAYVAALSAPHRAIADRIFAVVKSVAPKAIASIKWGQPVFEHGGPMMWLKAHSKHVGVGFWRGAELPDPKGLLEGDGDRMRHVKLRDAADIDDAAMRALVRAAMAANAAKGDPTKGDAPKRG